MIKLQNNRKWADGTVREEEEEEEGLCTVANFLSAFFLLREWQ